MKKKKKTQWLLVFLLILLLFVFLFSAYKLYGIVHEYRVAQRAYSNLSSQVVSTNSGQAQEGSQPGDNAGQGAENEPGLQEVSPITVDFATLRQRSDALVAWLYSPETVINYPVAHGQDNDYFLYRLYDGSYNPSGSLFLDFRCPSDFSGRNHIIYGHHMQDGSMLASITRYKNQEYYDAHPVLYLNTPEGNYRIDVFSGFVTSADSSVYTMSFDSDEQYQAFLTKMKYFSDFESDVEPRAEDRIVTLSTCTYEYDDARYVLLGKLIPIG